MCGIIGKDFIKEQVTVLKPSRVNWHNQTTSLKATIILTYESICLCNATYDNIRATNQFLCVVYYLKGNIVICNKTVNEIFCLIFISPQFYMMLFP